MAPLPTHTLLVLLRLYDSAIADLQAMGDPAVAKHIDRLALHRGDVAAALQAK